MGNPLGSQSPEPAHPRSLAGPIMALLVMLLGGAYFAFGSSLEHSRAKAEASDGEQPDDKGKSAGPAAEADEAAKESSSSEGEQSSEADEAKAKDGQDGATASSSKSDAEGQAAEKQAKADRRARTEARKRARAQARRRAARERARRAEAATERSSLEPAQKSDKAKSDGDSKDLGIPDNPFE
jgi:hypothetical protein